MISYILQLIQQPLYYDNLDTTATYTTIYYLIQHALCSTLQRRMAETLGSRGVMVVCKELVCHL